MRYAPFVFFAIDDAGYCVSARDTFALKRGVFFCAGCGQQLHLAGSEALPHFRHSKGAECEAAGQKALLAAALAVLTETRFIKAPARGRMVFERPQKHTYVGHEQWSSSSTNTVVDGVLVDFVAYQGAGKLLIHISIPGFLDTDRRDRVKQLDIPALEVVLAKPADIDGFTELNRVLLHETENKRWLLSDRERSEIEQHGEVAPAPAMTLAAEQFRAERFVSTKKMEPVGWQSARALVGNTLFRDMVFSDKLCELEKRMGQPKEEWPADIGLAVRAQECFGVEPRIWQADIYARFVSGAGGILNEPFTSEQVSQYLSDRYRIVAMYENAPVLAVYWYLRELVTRGTLLETTRGRFRVILNEALAERKLVWHSHCALSVAKLRTAATEVNLELPLPALRWLLEAFEYGRPSTPVAAFAQVLTIHAHAPLRQVIDFLLRAELLAEEGAKEPRRQSSLFDGH